MSSSLRRSAGTLVLALAATVLALPLAAPAQAEGPVERLWTLTTSGPEDVTYGFARADLPGGSFSAETESATAAYSDLSSSADGTRIAFVKDTATRRQILVRDFGGPVVRTAIDVEQDGSVLPYQPVLSPDGNTVAWTEERYSDAGATTYVVRKANVATGATSNVVSGHHVLAFATNGVLLVQHPGTGAARAVPVGGGALSGVNGLPAFADHVALNSDGTRIAWYDDTSAEDADVSTGDVRAAEVALLSGVWTVSNPKVLSGALDNGQPAFSRDGATVYWVQYDGDTGPGEVLSRPFDLSGPVTTVATTAGDELDVAVTGVPTSDAAPGAVVKKTAVLQGTSTKLRWTAPGDTDLSGYLVTRKVGSTVDRATVYVRHVPGAAEQLHIDSGLVLGRTYTYEIQTVDRANKRSAVETQQATALAAKPMFADPTSWTSTKAAFPVAFAATAPSAATYHVQYLVAGTSTWVSWVSGATGRVRTFGAPASTNVAATTSVPGRVYLFRVIVKDAFGNLSSRATSGRAVVPFDQSKASFGGGATLANSNSYLGGFRKLWSTSHSAKVVLKGNRFQVIGMRCTTCGSFDVYDNGVRVATVNAYSSTNKYRQVLFTRSYGSIGTHTFVIRPKGTAGHPSVMLDGFAMRL